MGGEGWFSVTPEPIAAVHAARAASAFPSGESGIVIDCFSGIGGNSIQFAATKRCHAIAIVIDPRKVELAVNNAMVYGVEDRIDFIVGDFFQDLPVSQGTYLLSGDITFGEPLLPFDNLEEQEDPKKDQPRPISYSYSFFHLIFSLASMYSAMLLTGWSTSVGESGKLVHVGWPSVWVRIVTHWTAAGLFIWSLIAPILFPDREF